MSAPPDDGKRLAQPDALAARQADDRASYGQIFKTTSVIGGASVINLLFGVVRTKVIALLLGPAGIGLLGILNALMSAAVTIAQMGLGTVGTRQIAEAHATRDVTRIAIATRALMIATVVLSVIGGGVVWMLRGPLATHVLQNEALAGAVGWAGLGVGLSVAALAQTALINGMRRIKDLALLQISGGLATTVIGLPLIWQFGAAAIPYYVVVMPLTSFLVGHFFVSRLPKRAPVSPSFAELSAQWRVFGALGLPVMAAAIVTTLAALWIQIDIKGQLGLEAAGFYIASNVIAVQYVGLVLGAMSADFYPRLTGVIQDHAAARLLVNQQTEVALVLAGPMIVAMFALAPWVIVLLYSDAFTPAADLLRWQAAGTLLKVVSFPLAFILRAKGAGTLYFVTEALTVLVLVVATTLLLDRFGLVGAGMGFFIAYAVYVPLLFVTAAPRIGFAWSKSVLLMLSALALSLLVVLWPVLAPSPLSITAGAVVGSANAFYFAIELNRKLGLARIVNRFRRGGHDPN